MCIRSRRMGFSLLELQVALIVFGFALAGLYPLAIMQSKQMTKIESRFNPATTYYLTPSSDEWVCKLGAAAVIRSQDPGPKQPPPILLIDNVNAGYSESGSGWEDETPADAYLGAARTHVAGTGANSAAWQFTGLKPGWYDVRVTWPSGPGRATNASYTISDGATNRGTYSVNQTLAPFGDMGQPWQCLAIVPVRGTALQVQLSDTANGKVSADAVRIIPIRNVVQVSGFARSLTGEKVTVGVTITVVTPQ